MQTSPIAGSIQRAYQSADRAISDHLRERGFDVTRAHSAVLANIDIHDGTRATQLADRASVTKQAIGQVVEDLELKGFVTRRVDPDDRRARLIQLTAKGRRVVAAAQELIEEIGSEVLEEVGHADLEATQRTLAAFAHCCDAKHRR